MHCVERLLLVSIICSMLSLVKPFLSGAGSIKGHVLRNQFSRFAFARSSSTKVAMSTALEEPAVEATRPKFAYSTAHESLPEETMYIFDGTAMLFNAYFASGGVGNGMNATFRNGSYVGQLTERGEAGAVLSPELNRRIIESMTDDQIRAMIECFNGVEPSAGSVAQPVTAVERANLQLRCEPLVSLLMQFARFVRDVKPKYVAVAFDAGRTTFRSELYPAYKEHRTPTPAMLVPLFPLTIRVLEAVGAVCLAQVGYEADDLMASLGRWARERGLNVVHFSQDKDMLQLVEPGVHVMNPKNRELVSMSTVQERYGVPHPSAMRDLQALMGDTADNVPGVRGIGEKTAAALINEFHSVPEMYAKLGLIDRPPPPASLDGLAVKSPEVKAALEQALTKAGVERAVNLLLPCFDGSKAKALTALTKLYLCGYQNVCLYKQLVTLREDLDIEQVVLHSGSHAEQVDRYRTSGISTSAAPLNGAAGDDVVDVVAATADLPMTTVASSAQVRGLVGAMQKVLLDPPAAERNSGDIRTMASGNNGREERLTTAYFRYTGERRHHAHTLTGVDHHGHNGVVTTLGVRSAEDVERLLADISPSLTVPLTLLREQYHKLSRD